MRIKRTRRVLPAFLLLAAGPLGSNSYAGAVRVPLVVREPADLFRGGDLRD